MQGQLPTGKRIAVLCIVLLVTMTANTMLPVNAKSGDSLTTTGLLKLGLFCFVCWKLYQGKAWARFGAIFGTVFLAILTVATHGGHGLFNIMGVNLACSVCIALLLLFGPGVHLHFNRGQDLDENAA